MIEALKSVPLFSELDGDPLSELARFAVRRRFHKGEGLYSEGDPAAGLFVILTGRVKIFKLSAEGKEQILHFFGTGEPIGEVAVFSGGAFPASAAATEPTETVYLARRDFIDLIGRHPAVALKMLAVLSRRLHHFTVIIDDLSLKEVPARLARYLLHLGSGQDDSDSLRLDMSKAQLAAQLGTIPETLSRALKKMVEAGLVRSKGSEIVILDRDRLENLSWSGRFGD